MKETIGHSSILRRSDGVFEFSFNGEPFDMGDSAGHAGTSDVERHISASPKAKRSQRTSEQNMGGNTAIAA